MNSYKLGGYSGCQILLIEDDDRRTFVRKISKDINYNERLQAQYEKQIIFSKSEIAVPEVYYQGYTDEGLFFFDMQYIQGITLAEYIKTVEIGKIKGLVDSLIEILIPKENTSCDSDDQDGTALVFSNKLADLRNTIKEHHNTVCDDALNLLEMHDWRKFRPSICHGDMTLDNIIIRNDRLYFIDFLDSFYDSWLLDAGTVLQDVQVMWSYRFQQDFSMNTVLRLIVFRDLFLDAIRRINPDYVEEAYYALLLKLLRIYPYAKDDFTYQFLNEKTGFVIEQIRKLED